jgi:excinuclease ABC subunit A
VGVLYILDEPSIGLHQRDNARLLDTLKRCATSATRCIVVEHDEETIREADHVIDLGPGAGKHGGEVIAEGTVDDIMKVKRSITGQYLTGVRSVPVPAARRARDPSACCASRGRASTTCNGWTSSSRSGSSWR